MKISIIIPVFNEEKSIEEVLRRIEEVPLDSLGVSDKEVVIVDDGSTDGTREILNRYRDKYKIIFHEKNQKLSAAMKTAFSAVTGDIIAIQHADLEYHPKDWKVMIPPLIRGEADMVPGSRYLAEADQEHFNKSYKSGAKLIVSFFNFVYGSKLTDIFTAARVFTVPVMKKFRFRSSGFAFETEFSAQAIRNGFKIKEIPISYVSRTFEEGKKLRWYDGFVVLWAIIKNRFF